MNLNSIFMIVMIAITGFTLLSYNLDDISERNTILDTNSQTLIDELQTDISTNLNIDDVDTFQSNLTANATNEGTVDFSREFREAKTETANQKNRIEKVTSIPSIIVKSLGIPQDETVSFILISLGVMLGFAIIISLYIAWKTGEVKDN